MIGLDNGLLLRYCAYMEARYSTLSLNDLMCSKFLKIQEDSLNLLRLAKINQYVCNYQVAT